eukprot:3573979-Rhodomonas_salina.1
MWLFVFDFTGSLVKVFPCPDQLLSLYSLYQECGSFYLSSPARSRQWLSSQIKRLCSALSAAKVAVCVFYFTCPTPSHPARTKHAPTRITYLRPVCSYAYHPTEIRHAPIPFSLCLVSTRSTSTTRSKRSRPESPMARTRSAREAETTTGASAPHATTPATQGQLAPAKSKPKS